MPESLRQRPAILGGQGTLPRQLDQASIAGVLACRARGYHTGEDCYYKMQPLGNWAESILLNSKMLSKQSLCSGLGGSHRWGSLDCSPGSCLPPGEPGNSSFPPSLAQLGLWTTLAGPPTGCVWGLEGCGPGHYWLFGTFQLICMLPCEHCMPFCLLHFRVRDSQRPALPDSSDRPFGTWGMRDPLRLMGWMWSQGQCLLEFWPQIMGTIRWSQPLASWPWEFTVEVTDGL